MLHLPCFILKNEFALDILPLFFTPSDLNAYRKLGIKFTSLLGFIINGMKSCIIEK